MLELVVIVSMGLNFSVAVCQLLVAEVVPSLWLAGVANVSLDEGRCSVE